jgi:hypothetical protein
LYVDDIEISNGHSTSFEDGWDGWQVPGVPPDSTVQNTIDFTRSTLADAPAAAIIATLNTIWFGFGLEGVATPEDRAAILDRVMQHFGVDPPPQPASRALYLPMLRRGG